MKVARRCVEASKSWLRAGVAAGLCGLLVVQPVLAEGMGGRKPKVVRATEIDGEQRVLQALNRLTFGPRPGDVAAVQAMGLEHWFEQQLNPGGIDDSALDARLAMYPAMRMQQAELMERYPTPQALRQMMQNHEPLPRDPVEHAIYADGIAGIQAAQAKQEAASLTAQTGDGGAKKPGENAAAIAAGLAALQGDGMDSAAPAMATHEEQFYQGLEAVKVVNLPPEERVKRILAMKPEELIAFRKSLNQSELAAVGEGLTPLQKETLEALQGSERLVGAEVLQSRLLRDIYSDRQLEAVMTEFWLNHFNVYLRKNQNEPFLLPTFERDVVRPHALGKFEDLLVATAKSPAMLMYLDNWQSVGPDSMAARNGGRIAPYAKNPQVKQALQDRGLNENYARELMELHTVGVQCEVSMDHPASALPAWCGQGYTQQDVTNVAKVLTGWTIDRPVRGAEFQFEERRHEPGSKTVLGMKIREGGEKEGLEVLHVLATSPATAQFISTKLAVRFVSDTPPQALVDRMAQSFVTSGGDMRTVLRTMFRSSEFWSPEVYRAKVKTPLEFVASAVRASGADIENAQPLVQALDRLGMPLYGMQTPNGYSWTAEPWVSTSSLVNRMNFALLLSGNRLPGTRTDWTTLLGSGGGELKSASMSAGATEDAAVLKEKRLEGLLIGQPVSEQTRETVLRQFGDTKAQMEAEKSFPIKASNPAMMAGPVPGGMMAAEQDRQKVVVVDPQAAVMAGLLIGSPEFQRR